LLHHAELLAGGLADTGGGAQAGDFGGQVGVDGLEAFELAGPLGELLVLGEVVLDWNREQRGAQRAGDQHGRQPERDRGVAPAGEAQLVDDRAGGVTHSRAPLVGRGAPTPGASEPGRAGFGHAPSLAAHVPLWAAIVAEGAPDSLGRVIRRIPSHGSGSHGSGRRHSRRVALVVAAVAVSATGCSTFTNKDTAAKLGDAELTM